MRAVPTRLARRPSATTLTASNTVAGFNEDRTEYDWSFVKRVKAIMDRYMEPTGSISDAEVLPGGEASWVEYTFDVTRSVKSRTALAGARGSVCVVNTGDAATNGLAVNVAIQGAGTSLTRAVNVAAKPVLQAGERYCYPYEIPFAATAGSSYQSSATTTIANAAGQIGAAQTSFAIPTTQSAVARDEKAVLHEGLEQSCANIFPSLICIALPITDLTFTQSGHYDLPWTVDMYNYRVCGEDLPFTNVATLTESGPYAAGERPETHSSQATIVFHTGKCAPKPANPGCTYTQGYWKNHAWPAHPRFAPRTLATWPDDNDWKFFDTTAEWPDVLNIQPRGDAYYILAHQYIAAILNQQNGAYVPDGVRAVLLSAYQYFSSSPAVRATYDRNTLTTWANLLDRYNPGQLGVPHCG